MTKTLCILFFFLISLAKGQDKVFLLDGRCLEGKVIEINVEDLKLKPADLVDTLILKKETILLVEYRNGIFEIYNKPTTNKEVSAKTKTEDRVAQISKEADYPNLVYINTLALCNADLAFFAERLNKRKILGFGLMGAYNFNHYATLPNLFIAILSNAKKNYDLGLFVNLYPSHFKRKTTFGFGVLLKYMNFRYTSVIEERNPGGTSNIRYENATGGQLATIFTGSLHTKLASNYFIRSSVGLGGFNLRGKYREQYNYVLNADRAPRDPVINRKFLAKAYLAISVGYNF